MKNLPFLLVLLFLNLRSQCQIYVSKTIKDFGAKGDGKTNDHEAFKKAAKFFSDRKGYGRLIISKGVYLVGKQVKGGNGAAWLGEDVLSFKSCKNLTIEGKNASIKLQGGMKVGSFDPRNGKPYESKLAQFTEYGYLAAPGDLIVLKECEGIRINSLKLEGNNRNIIEGGKFGDQGFQVPGDGIEIIDSKDILIDQVEADYFVRDGLQIINKTPEEWKTASQKIKLKNCSFAYNGRQGLSWVGGVGLDATNCKFDHSGRGGVTSAPAAGVDIEAEVGVIRDGKFIDCEFVDNVGCGFVADSGPSRDVQCVNCTFWGTTNWSMWTTKPNYDFASCKFYGSIVQGYDSPNDSDATKFIKCTFEDKPYKGIPPYGSYLVEINSKKRMLFDTCTFITRTKKIFWFEGNPSWKPEEKPLITRCNIHIYPIKFTKPDFLAKMHGVRWDSAHYYIYMKESDYLQNYYMPGGDVTFLGNSTVKYIAKK
jgi:hypothetical protein